MNHPVHLSLIVAAGLAVGTRALAQGEHSLDLSALPEAGEVAPEDGLAAWDSIHTVLTHPRCLNCHVGAESVPLWGTPDAPDRVHGMAINAGDSRIGAETMSCNACHQTSTRPTRCPTPRRTPAWTGSLHQLNSSGPNAVAPRSAPRCATRTGMGAATLPDCSNTSCTMPN